MYLTVGKIMLIIKRGNIVNERMIIALLTVLTSTLLIVLRFLINTPIEKESEKIKITTIRVWKIQVDEKMRSKIEITINTEAMVINNTIMLLSG